MIDKCLLDLVTRISTVGNLEMNILGEVVEEKMVEKWQSEKKLNPTWNSKCWCDVKEWAIFMG